MRQKVRRDNLGLAMCARSVGVLLDLFVEGVTETDGRGKPLDALFSTGEKVPAGRGLRPLISESLLERCRLLSPSGLVPHYRMRGHG